MTPLTPGRGSVRPRTPSCQKTRFPRPARGRGPDALRLSALPPLGLLPLNLPPLFSRLDSPTLAITPTGLCLRGDPLPRDPLWTTYSTLLRMESQPRLLVLPTPAPLTLTRSWKGSP